MLSCERSLLPSRKGMEMKNERAILPQDIIVEILKRLPGKSLLRFRSVCKLWNNLIKSPSFISTHLHYSAHNNPFLFFGENRSRHCNFRFLLSLDSNMKPVEVKMTHKIPCKHSYFVRLVGSCNGLFLLEMDYINGGDDEYYLTPFYSLFLWNPATREIRQVPDSTHFHSHIPPSYGFGFNPVLNDYKLVRIYTGGISCAWYQPKMYAEVYSLRRGSWKQVESMVLIRVRYLRYFQAVISNGTMFWLEVVDEHDLHMVVSFDIATEVFSLMPIPSSITPRSDSNIKLSVHENKLAMFRGPYKIGNAYSSFFDLWVMEEEGNSLSWTRKFSIGPTSNWLYPLCIWSNEIVCTNWPIPDEFSGGDHHYQVHFFLSLFNLTTKEWTSHNYRDQFSYNEDIFNYAESLVCL